MSPLKNNVTLHGNSLRLVGGEVAVGQKLPDFTVLDNDLNAVSPSDFAGKTLVICSVPSLDTPVCDVEARRFNEQAAALGDGVAVLFISVDLPFAQKRWCAGAGIDNVQTLSDHRDTSFGLACGVLIEDLRLLARAVFIVDGGGAVRYIQFVDEVADEPDYEAVLNAIKAIKGIA